MSDEIKDMLKDIKATPANPSSNTGSPCPIDPFQASILLYSLNTLSEEQIKLTESIAKLKTAVDELVLESATEAGFKKGANFWFKLGVIGTIATIGGGVIAFGALVTGKLDLWSLLQ